MRSDGLYFSYLYVKTKRIIVPIISHMAMNTLVTVVQINELKKQASLLDMIHGWIGGIHMRSPLASGILYIFLGVVFTYFAIQQVIVKDWNFIAYLLLIIATFDFGRDLDYYLFI
ncbi:DUF4305 domain-containing protein [Bacillus sp. N9]